MRDWKSADNENIKGFSNRLPTGTEDCYRCLGTSMLTAFMFIKISLLHKYCNWSVPVTEAPRPNTPINAIVGTLIIKEMIDYYDDEIVENLILDLHLHYTSCNGLPGTAPF